MDLQVTQLTTRLYAVIVDGVFICRSKTPLLSAARVLLERGVPRDTELRMFWYGSKIASLRTTVGEAAAWTVKEERKYGPVLRAYRPPERLR